MRSHPSRESARHHEQARRNYNRIGRFYDLIAERSERRARNLGLRLLGARADEKILEVGFGTGHGLVSLARAVGPRGEVLGIDISETMAAIAKARLSREGLSDRVKIICRDAIPLPYVDASLDAVFLSFVLELFEPPDMAHLLSECRRVLRPGGRIVVVGVSKEQEPPTLALRLYEWAHARFPRMVDCRPILVQYELEQAGFVIEESRMCSAWVPVQVVRGSRGVIVGQRPPAP